MGLDLRVGWSMEHLSTYSDNNEWCIIKTLQESKTALTKKTCIAVHCIALLLTSYTSPHPEIHPSHHIRLWRVIHILPILSILLQLISILVSHVTAVGATSAPVAGWSPPSPSFGLLSDLRCGSIKMIKRRLKWAQKLWLEPKTWHQRLRHTQTGQWLREKKKCPFSSFLLLRPRRPPPPLVVAQDFQLIFVYIL